ncbi:MAG TPA: asparagine synthase-related protein, partial [Chroococcales cyanobacterium]
MIGLSGEIWGAIDFAPQPDSVWIREASQALAGQGSTHSVGCCLLKAARPFSNPATTREFIPAEHLRGLQIAAQARLHNRGDLIDRFDSELSNDLTDDALLILLAYQKWGQDCGRHLIGEFTFAIWNEISRELFCCRDHMGFRPFVYWQQGTRFVFSSDLRYVLRTPGVPRRLNARKFAGLTIYGGAALHHEDTFHAEIQSLPGGNCLTVSFKGVQKSRFWQPEIRPELVPRRRSDAFEALRELLSAAVENRMADDVPVAAELSGGLDSSAIVAVAARTLEKRGRTLLALSSVLSEESLRLYSDERRFAEEFRSSPNIQIEYVTAEGRGPFDDIEDCEQFTVTPIRPAIYYLQVARNQRAWSQGARLRLRGLLGEMGPTASGDRYLIELAVKLRWPELWKQLRGFEKVEHVAPFRYFARQVWKIAAPHLPGNNSQQVLLT